jgi:hypothetical protein
MTDGVDIPPALHDRLHEIAQQGGTAYCSEIVLLVGIDTHDPNFGANVG